MLLRTGPYAGARAMAVTTFERGVQQGWRAALQRLLEARFGPLSTEVRERLEGLDSERLEALTVPVLTARSLQELGLED